MKQQLELNGHSYIVESSGGKYIISKKDGTPDTEEAILVLRAIEEGKGKPVK
jgi:hypothetical protein